MDSIKNKIKPVVNKRVRKVKLIDQKVFPKCKKGYPSTVEKLKKSNPITKEKAIELGRGDGAIDCEGRPICLPESARARRGYKGVAVWLAPATMPDWQVLTVLQGAMCGAPLDDGTFCRNPPPILRSTRIPFKCMHHGGAVSSTYSGNPKEGSINTKYGLYTDAMTDDECRVYSDLKIDSLEDEIRNVKLRLRRLLIGEHLKQKDIDYLTEEYGTDSNGDFSKTITRFTGMSKQIDRVIKQLCLLYQQHREVLNTANSMNVFGDSIQVYLPDNGRAVNTPDILGNETEDKEDKEDY